jgi:hypothetical protein
MKKTRPMSVEALLVSYVQQFAGLKQQIKGLGYFCKGTVLKRMMKCGQKRCACHKDPTKRHGPYFEWTYKAKGKTVNIRLRPAEADVYRAATQQYRKLKAVTIRMESLSRKAVIILAKRACLNTNHESSREPNS